MSATNLCGFSNWIDHLTLGNVSKWRLMIAVSMGEDRIHKIIQFTNAKAKMTSSQVETSNSSRCAYRRRRWSIPHQSIPDCRIYYDHCRTPDCWFYTSQSIADSCFYSVLVGKDVGESQSTLTIVCSEKPMQY
jgi:hypothetical protein